MLDPCLGTGSVRAAGVAKPAAAGRMAGISISARPTRPPTLTPPRSARAASAAFRRRSIVTSDTCPMRDESVAYGRRLTECGVQVEAHVVREEGDPVLPGTELPLWPTT